ncbi:MAG: DNA adenine methylase [candidate division Zixibacteria bacterium]|nr:DNA adenine methylase [candidate division Zixibacteria bacterium]
MFSRSSRISGLKQLAAVAPQNHAFISPLRYPGGKGMLAKYLRMVVTENNLQDGHYVEVFAGGAGVAWSMLLGEYVRHVHINDLDRAIHSFWISVLNNTDDLCRLINDTRISMSQWHRQKAIHSDPDQYRPLELGFATFYLNRTNRSGIIGGGVIGGKNQTGKWKLDARFNKGDLISRIQRIARYRSRISVYRLDARDFIGQELPKLPKQTLVYLDPPYYAKGSELYQNHFVPSDHESLASAIQGSICQPWVVSYDSVPEIASLYENRRKLCYNLSYSAQARYSGKEIMFFSDDLRIPDVPHPVITQASRNRIGQRGASTS